jgi:hypothetical protein
MTRMICRLPLVASLVLLLNVILAVSLASDAMAAGTWSTTGSMTVHGNTADGRAGAGRRRLCGICHPASVLIHHGSP